MPGSCATVGVTFQNEPPKKMQSLPPHDPMRIANMAQDMARKAQGADSVVFNKVALVCMGVMALASVAQVFHLLLRDLNRKEQRERGGRE